MANSPQRLLVDTDAYCKLSVAGLFEDAVAALNVEIEECGRLAALPYMLKRGRLRMKYGGNASDTLRFRAEGMPVAISPSDTWLDPLTEMDSIDPGEAQLLATSAEHGLFLLTGDKRALLRMDHMPGYGEALNGRVIVLEAILAELCIRVGVNEIRPRIRPAMRFDTAIRVCFSDSNPAPLAGLLSYYKDLTDQLRTVKLWNPPSVAIT